MAANGMVQCKNCQQLFDAYLFLPQPEVDETQAPDTTLRSEPPFDPEDDLIDRNRSALPYPEQPSIPYIIADQLTHLDHQTDAPLILLQRILTGFVFIALLTAFFLQLIAMFKLDLLPPLARTTCQWITCKEKPTSDLSKIEILNRNIFTHPHKNNAFIVTLTIINRATFSQPYPVIQLRLHDLSGTVVATRQFSDQDYLDTRAQTDKLMPPETPYAIQFEITDSGEEIAGYDFTFL